MTSLPYKLALLWVLGGIAPWAQAQQVADAIQIKDPFVRAVPAGQQVSAAFMTIHNDAAQEHALVSTSSDAAKVVELHTHINEEGMMKMRKVERIALPAQGQAQLQPGGLHIMLINLTRPVNEGDQVMLTLEYEDGSRTQVTAPVRSVVPAANHLHQHH